MNRSTYKSLNWIIALIGVWEVISPFVLGFRSMNTAMVDAVIVGGVLIVFGIVSAFSRGAARVLDWLNALLGIWLIIAPFFLAFAALTRAGEISSIITGVVVLILGIWAALAASRSYRSRAMATENMAAAVPVTGSGMETMDSHIQRTVMDRLTQDSRMDASGIDVTVNHGEVTLRGSVPSAEEKLLAENDAQGVSGVSHVKDELRVASM